MSGGAHLSVAFWPATEDMPRGQVRDTHAALFLSNLSNYQHLHLQFSSGDEQQTVLYLRELARVAADLADQVEAKS